ncbi:putative homoserine kinase [Plesiocystis pacifica SIR-1]|uniref:Putative homoserine kinase n=1 Tax=Plesiocystis pacifica SIR-1 TaxID=391625 RepID=A6G1I2_9BACT|nr:homoserine kinase [Plesiocystis pacifica]EDM80246.1 putative homoserine kinase [Plesiocystis pacifica SIR-1]
MNRLHAFIDLDRGAVADLTADYSLGELRSVEPLVTGIINTNYVLRTDAGDFLLRLYPPERSADALRFEFSTLARLAEANFPCPRVIANREGKTVAWSEAHARHYAVLEFIPGTTLPREAIDAGVVDQIGSLFADMQRTLSGFVPEGDKPRADLEFVRELGQATLDRIAALPGEGPATAERLRQVWARSHARFDQPKGSVPALERGVVHADLYFDNVIVEGDQIRGVIDFDDSYFGLFLIDLAVTLMEFTFVEADALDFELGERLLRRYYARRPEAKGEAHLLHDGMICACYKYLGYTADLPEYAGEALLGNEYIARIDYLARPEIRAKVEAMIAAAVEVPA